MPLVTQAAGDFLSCTRPAIAGDGQSTVAAHTRRPDMSGHKSHNLADRKFLTPWLVDELVARMTP